jgi:hypothetical protein
MGSHWWMCGSLLMWLLRWLNHIRHGAVSGAGTLLHGLTLRALGDRQELLESIVKLCLADRTLRNRHW